MEGAESTGSTYGRVAPSALLPAADLILGSG